MCGMRKNSRLKAELEELYARYNHPDFIHEDPLGMAGRELAPEDFEIVSFIVAGLSYGRVEQIRASAKNLLARLAPWEVRASGEGLAKALSAPDFVDSLLLRGGLGEWRHRLNTPEDATDLLRSLAGAKRRHGSLCRLFQAMHHEDPVEQIHAFSAELRGGGGDRPAGKSAKAENWPGTGLSWFASSPRDGGTCKRLMMWFRWMVRSDRVDPGVWHRLAAPELPPPKPERLFWPVDTHVFRWAKSKGITRRASPNWKAVEEITAFFREIEPRDPVKYDFAVCHVGMDRARSREIRGNR